MTPSSYSHAFSILKCDYGWNGVVPAGVDLDAIVAKANGPVCAATMMARSIHAAGGCFRKRIDGRVNRRVVR